MVCCIAVVSDGFRHAKNLSDVKYEKLHSKKYIILTGRVILTEISNTQSYKDAVKKIT
jgi:hypothetical protein